MARIATQARSSGAAPTSLRERQKEFTRRQLLDAAHEEFAARGYESTTVEDIVARAGASRATFYMHFESKAQMVAEVAERLQPMVDECCRRLDVALAAGSRTDLSDWLEYVSDWYAQYGGCLASWEGLLAVESGTQITVKGMFRHLPDVMSDYIERWPADQRAEARLRIVLLAGQVERAFSTSPPNTWSASERSMFIDVMTDLWYDALRIPKAQPARRIGRA
jgi:AcrR family transcriptional regulator